MTRLSPERRQELRGEVTETRCAGWPIVQPNEALALLADSDALDRVLDLHQPVDVDGLPWCEACDELWTCATRLAIREVTGD